MVERATQLIMLDASLGCRSQDLLQKLVPSGCRTPAFAMLLQNCHEQLSGERGRGVRIWNNTRRTDSKAYLMHTTTTSFHAAMHELLEQGKKLAIVSNICSGIAQKMNPTHSHAFIYPFHHVLLRKNGANEPLAVFG